MVARKASTTSKTASSSQRVTAKPRASDLPGRLSSHRSLLGGFNADDLALYLDVPEVEGPVDARKRQGHPDGDLKTAK